MRTLRVVAGIAVISTTLGLCGSPAPAQNVPAPKTAPDFTLTDSKGNTVKLSEPHMFVIDAAGNLVYHGGIDNDPAGDKTEGKVNYVAQALNELLAGKPGSVPETKSYGCSVKFALEGK